MRTSGSLGGLCSVGSDPLPWQGTRENFLRGLQIGAAGGRRNRAAGCPGGGTGQWAVTGSKLTPWATGQVVWSASLGASVF